MPHPRKYFPNGSVIFATMSVEQGLLLPCNPLIESMIKSTLARARQLFPVQVCHLLVEATHVHMLLRVIGPDDTANFIGYFKAELAHRINQLMGWSKRTVWCEGYDSPVVLTPTRALIAIAYLYSNPAKDNLEDSLEIYPGFSTWRMFRSGQFTHKWKHYSRPFYQPLLPNQHTAAIYGREAVRLAAAKRPVIEFSIEPDAWLEAYGITDPEEQMRWNQRLVERIRILEERARKKRKKEGKSCIGSAALSAQRLTLDYQPKRTGRRMSCLSEKRSRRMEFLDFLKDLVERAREVLLRWRVGDYSVLYPPGLFTPSMPKLLEPIGCG